MQSLSQCGAETLEARVSPSTEQRRREDRMYQAMTVAAIIGVLFSVWVF